MCQRRVQTNFAARNSFGKFEFENDNVRQSHCNTHTHWGIEHGSMHYHLPTRIDHAPFNIEYMYTRNELLAMKPKQMPTLADTTLNCITLNGIARRKRGRRGG